MLRRIQEAFERWDAVQLFRQDDDTLLVQVRSDALLQQICAKAGDLKDHPGLGSSQGLHHPFRDTRQVQAHAHQDGLSGA
ncbi:MAG: hypothetical protein MZV70_14120 [Desulfobacterales bacterium]|nr:hypothetical protein [Desulfobacterales bacterium]